MTQRQQLNRLFSQQYKQVQQPQEQKRRRRPFSSSSSSPGTSTTAHHQQQSPFFKCTSRSLIRFLFVTIIIYLCILSSWINSTSLSSLPLASSSSLQTTDWRTVGSNDNNNNNNNNFVQNDDGINNTYTHNNSNTRRNSKKKIKNKDTKPTAIDRIKPITIGVASTLTGCSSTDPYVDGAAVLKYSLDVNSAKFNTSQSKYIYENIILYHPNASHCVAQMQHSELGYILMKTETPINVDDIQGDGGLRERIVTNGCCGEKELIKLESFRLTQYPLVIHLDLDAVINKPMDDVLDFMLDPKRFQASSELRAKVPLMWREEQIPNQVEFVFTKDYNVVAPKRADKPYQGGFFIIKPSIDTYNEFVGIVRSGDYDIKKGWGGKVGPFHGGMTIQGLFPWYYQYLHPGNSVELNRCIFNNMNDIPYFKRNNGKKICRTNEEECEDCRYTNMTEVVTFHFTICQKPWHCLEYKHQLDNFRLCRQMNKLWYTMRSQLESSWGRTGKGTGSLKPEHYNGYCRETGANGYERIQAPYGKPLLSGG